MSFLNQQEAEAIAKKMYGDAGFAAEERGYGEYPYIAIRYVIGFVRTQEKSVLWWKWKAPVYIIRGDSWTSWEEALEKARDVELAHAEQIKFRTEQATRLRKLYDIQNP